MPYVNIVVNVDLSPQQVSCGNVGGHAGLGDISLIARSEGYGSYNEAFP
jgi:hypothetical protein